MKITQDTMLNALANQSLDGALAVLFAVLDPENKNDLGGLAGHVYSGEFAYTAPADNGIAFASAATCWPYWDAHEREEHLNDFLVSASAWA